MLKTVMESELSESKLSWCYDDYNVNSDNHGDGYDGSRDTAKDIENNNDIVITASNQSEIDTNIIERGQGTTQAIRPIPKKE